MLRVTTLLPLGAVPKDFYIGSDRFGAAFATPGPADPLRNQSTLAKHGVV
jgi:hypothetical protein